MLEDGPDGRAKSVRFHVEIMGLSDLYINEYTWDGDRRVDWTMSQGRSQKSQVGWYELTPAGNGATKVTYDLTVEIGDPGPGPHPPPHPGQGRRHGAERPQEALRGLSSRTRAGVA